MITLAEILRMNPSDLILMHSNKVPLHRELKLATNEVYWALADRDCQDCNYVAYPPVAQAYTFFWDLKKKDILEIPVFAKEQELWKLDQKRYKGQIFCLEQINDQLMKYIENDNKAKAKGWFSSFI